MEPLFHLSIPVDDLGRAKKFYLETLGCKMGRETNGRFDINFFGHHIVAHLSPREAQKENGTIPSDGDIAPLRHFGVILTIDDWKDMEQRLADTDVDFVLSPRLSFAGKPAEQHIMMLRDGCGNVVEFKSQPRDRVFATDRPS
ncbi:MAG: glyoxalase [Hyphomicrobiaceae bacterium TMED74]|nr:glyoxalase [Filomicrobium sp.]RPG40645.1 MAG: glyoxalase [Hyphomicrobiaceae bacterium TMED74]